MLTPLIFFGSDRFSAIVLSEMIRQNHVPKIVVTDPPKPKGKKGEIEPNEVEKFANNQSLKVLYYQSNNDELINFVKKYKPIGLTASFPHLFPSTIISAFDDKLYNLHPSLLPQYRNVAPGPYAIAMGDNITGISLFPIGVGIDNGELVAQQKENILPTDTTSALLARLFTIGTQLFIKFISDPNDSTLTSDIPIMRSSDLIFTRKLTRQSGFVEWEILQKLISNIPITVDESSNPIIKLRLTHHPDRTSNILPDLIRALDTYERVWTIAPTVKGELQLTLSLSASGEIMVLIPGKPKPIVYGEFAKYYL